MCFEDTNKEKKDGAVEEKRKERRKGCALVSGNEGVSLSSIK